MQIVIKHSLTTISVLSLLSLSACSTMFGDNQREVTIERPKGATVSVNNHALTQKTPTKAVITQMWSPTTITVTQPGCPPQSVTIKPEFQPIGLLNILVFPGFIIDAVTGDMMKIPDDQRTLTLKHC